MLSCLVYFPKYLPVEDFASFVVEFSVTFPSNFPVFDLISIFFSLVIVYAVFWEKVKINF